MLALCSIRAPGIAPPPSSCYNLSVGVWLSATGWGQQMIEVLSNIFTSFGLSASAGLNAYLPLLIVALAARFTDLIRLSKPFDALTHGSVIAILAVLTLIEVLVDKIPAVDTINDIIQTVMRPAAGAIVFAASSNAIADIHPVLAMICGILVAGTVHAAKATARPLVTATTAGTANPIVSTAEDVSAGVVSVLSILMPIAAFLLVVIGIWLILRALRQRRARV